MSFQTKAIVRYAVMPEVLPRLRALFFSGFGYIAFLMAQIYFTVRLLPAGHSYLNPANIGKYGIRHVIAEASNNLVIKRQNLDQCIVFLLILTGIVLLGLQIALVVTGFVLQQAHAASIFVTPNPNKDIAYMLLDQVFGVPSFFGSCVSTNVLCANETTNPAFPWPFHLALQKLFSFYSTGILLIGTVIILYFIVVVLVETATTGHPFGQRFKNMMVPVRIVVAVGLLIPLNYGYNSGQLITLGAAKYGSSLATNAWIQYNNTISAKMGAGANPTGESESLIGLPKPMDTGMIAEAMSIVHTCAFAYYIEDAEITGKTKDTLPDPVGNIANYQSQNKVKPYLVKNVSSWMTDTNERLALTSGTTYADALKFYDRSDIVIRFGRFDDKGQLYTDSTGQVEPTCGDVRVKVGDPRDQAGAGTGYIGTVAVQELFFNLIRDIWFDTARNEDYIDFAGRFYLKQSNNDDFSPCDMGCQAENPYLPKCGAKKETDACHTDDIDPKWKQNASDVLQTYLNAELINIWNRYNQEGLELEMKPEVLEYGWGGAGIWFNSVAQVNGAFASSMYDFPSMDKYPNMMERVRAKKTKTDVDNTSGMFDPNIGEDSTGQYEASDPNAKTLAIVLHKVHEYWNRDNKNSKTTEKVVTTGALENGMNMVFGTEGLFAMTSENNHVHPLAQLVMLGKGLVETAIRNVAGSTTASALGGLFGSMVPSAGPFAEVVSRFALSTAIIGLTAGVVLYYVVPFLPFLYFYFAVGSWIKTIFEAMVGVPLWALAHLRLSGEGLPGEGASNGYFLIFEIFVRPVLSVFGLIAALAIFAAEVRILHFVWSLVTTNVGGFNADATIGLGGDINFKRSIIDQFFFTVLYAMIVYMLATTSFKLVDRIPDQILRWMGAGVSSFSDINQDSIETITRYVATGGLTAGQQIVGGVNQLGRGLGGAIGQTLNMGGPKVP